MSSRRSWRATARTPSGRFCRVVGLMTSLVVMITVLASPAQADTVTSYGISSNRNMTVRDIGPVGYTADSGCYPGRSRGSGFVVLAGDYVYVRDDCRDGRAVKAVVMWTRSGIDYRRNCVNKTGYGTQVRCNFDWPETGLHTLLFYAHKGAEDMTWDFGSLVHWRDDSECLGC